MFFRLYFHYCSSSVHYCKDHSHIQKPVSYYIWLPKIAHNDFNLVLYFVPKILEDFFLDLFQKKRFFE